jgi:hypothetical protein
MILEKLDNGVRNEVVKFALARNLEQAAMDIANHSLEFVVFKNFRDFVNHEAEMFNCQATERLKTSIETGMGNGSI